MNTTEVRFAYTAIVEEAGYSVGRADENIPGYTPMCRKFDTYQAAKVMADGLNADLGLSKRDALVIVMSTMRGAA
jgi:hypothetical protein